MDTNRNEQPASPRLDFTLNALPAPYHGTPYGRTPPHLESSTSHGRLDPFQSVSANPDIPLGRSASTVDAHPSTSASIPSAPGRINSIGDGGGDPGPSTAAAMMLSKLDHGPSRKQNVACDACRTKKIRCRRTTTAENCEQCSAKGATCTSNYIEQLQAKAKKARQEKGTYAGSASASSSLTTAAEPGVRPSSAGLKRKRSGLEEEDEDRDARRGSTTSQPTPHRQPANLPRYHHNPARPPSDLRPSEKQANLVRYMLSPTAVTHHHLGYSDLSSMEGCEAGNTDIWEEQGGRVWLEEPSEAHAGLTDVGTRELADDLVDTFSTLVHPRFAMLDLSNIRARLSSPDTHPDGPVPHNLLAVAIAFGGRFSDHGIINSDREECMTRDEADQGRPGRVPPRSRLVQLLVIRAREVVEVQKTHRMGSLGNVQVLILLEHLLAQAPFLRDRYTRYNFTGAVRHVDELGYNDPKVLARMADDKKRASAVFVWWFVCVNDGFQSVLHRLRPSLSETSYELGDFDLAHAAVKTYTSEQLSGDSTEQSVALLGAASAGSKMCRQLCADLWHPRVHATGIPLAALETFISACSSWRDNFLSRLGVPSKWPEGWSFDAAITACSTDAFYHALWLVVERAIKDFGVAELRAADRPPGMVLAAQIEVARKRIREEAAHGALRITSLTSTLALNQYLRLDPLILHQPICEAGLFLAEQGREECMIAVAGLQQYCIPYPQFWPRAEEIERLFRARQASVATAYATGSDHAPLPYTGAAVDTPHSGASITGSHASGMDGASSASSVSGRLPELFGTLPAGAPGMQGGSMGTSTYGVSPGRTTSTGGMSGHGGSYEYGERSGAGGPGGHPNGGRAAKPGSIGFTGSAGHQQEHQKEISMALFEWLHGP